MSTVSLSSSNSSICFDEWQPYLSSCLSFDEYRREGTLCDVVLKVQDARFPAHRLVLCVHSEYFRSLFLGGWRSSESQEIEIPGISPETMSALLNFAYTRQISVTTRTVEELLPAADQFLFPELKERCSSFLKKQLAPENCVGIRKFAKAYFCHELEDAATDFILSNFEDVAKESSEFLNMNYEEIARLISDDRLNVRLEEIVCEAVYRWVKHDVANRKQHLYRLFRKMRLGLLDPEYLMSKVKGNELVMENKDQFRPLLKEAMKFVYDLHSPESNIRLTENSLFHRLMRPRLPIEILLAIGGWSGGSPTNAIEAYDPRAENWVNVSSMQGICDESPRAYHGVAFTHGNVYVIGGFDGVNYFNSMRRFNVEKNQWFQEPAMLHKRCYVSVAVMKKKLFALGGMDGENRLNVCEMYDSVKKCWSVLSEMNERRSDASATSLNDRVYIAGGFNGQECLFTAEFYDPRGKVWTWITPMSSRRSGVSITTLHGKMYAVGGFDGVNRLRSAESYCPDTNTWRPIATMNKPRSNFGLDVIDDQLIAVGGFNGQQTSSDVEVYDDATNEWYEVREMQIFRSALSCCVLSGLSHDVIKRFCVSREMEIMTSQSESRRPPVTTAVDNRATADISEEDFDIVSDLPVDVISDDDILMEQMD